MSPEPDCAGVRLSEKPWASVQRLILKGGAYFSNVDKLDG